MGGNRFSRILIQQAKPYTNVRQVATRCVQSYSGLSDGVVNNWTYRLRHILPNECTDIQFIFGNYYPSVSTPYEIAGVNDITIKVSIEYNSILYPLTFSGQDSYTLKAGGIIKSDPIGILFPTNSTIYSRIFVTVPEGGKYPLGIFTNSANGEGATAGDKTVTGTMYPNTNAAFSPIGIIGKVSCDTPSLFLFGDSIMQGVNDSDRLGYAIRGLNDDYAYTNHGLSSDRSYYALSPYRYRFYMTQYCTHAICEIGINDINAGQSFEQIKAQLLNIWNTLKFKGLKVYQCTITPKSTSTDSWATVQNQAIFNVAYNNTRKQLNDWIRSCPSPLSGFFEIADLAETSRGSGIWKAGYTSDGLHPNTTGHIALSSGININCLN